MIVLNHGASFAVAEDVELVRERVHPATMAAEGPLHELGAIAIVNSDSQGMGRMMETVRRTFQLAHVMGALVGRRACAGRRYDTTERVLRYLAKVTIEPAITHGIADHVGSLQPRPPRRHRPVGAGLLRRQAGARAQGGHAGLGRRSARATRRSKAPSRRATGPTGAAGRGPAASLSATFVSRPGDWARPELRRHGRELIAVRGHARADPRLAGPEPGGRAAIEVDVADGRVRWTAGRSPSSRSRGAASRRYLLR